MRRLVTRGRCFHALHLHAVEHLGVVLPNLIPLALGVAHTSTTKAAAGRRRQAVADNTIRVGTSRRGGRRGGLGQCWRYKCCARDRQHQQCLSTHGCSQLAVKIEFGRGAQKMQPQYSIQPITNLRERPVKTTLPRAALPWIEVLMRVRLKGLPIASGAQ